MILSMRTLVRPLVGLLAASVWLGALTLRATSRDLQDPPPAPQANADNLSKQVYAIFKQHCIECHGAAKESGLDLRTEAGLQTGGRRGKVVVAHKPSESRLYQAVMHDGDLQMPDGKDQLPESDRDVIKRWIELGASLAAVPEAVAAGANPDAAALARLEERPITAAERDYWAFKLPVRSTIPTVTRQGWTSNPIDAFLLSAMEARGLKPAPPADKRALVRRLYLDVLGLPPTPEEVDAFIKDTSADAWPTLVDKVLASPHYGERWARHWMDVVRYADSGGFEFDVDRAEMYRYRDYLVESFNRDKPYDEFVKEQIAGDEYAAGYADKKSKDDAMIATGFMRLGAEGGGRPEALDDLVSTTSLAFLGMTVGCARCHNHKFDPIPQKDYYRMQAVFFSTRDVDYPLVPQEELDRNRAETARIDALIKPIRDRKTQLEKPYHQQIIDREVAKLPDYMQIAWKTPVAERTEGQRLNVIQIESTLAINSLRKLVTEKDVVALMPADVQAQHAGLKAQIDALEKQKPRRTPSARAIGERGRVPQPSFFLFRGSQDARGSQMTPGVLAVTRTSEWSFPEPPPDATSSLRRRGFAEWLVSPDNPLTARVMVNRLWQHHFGEGLVRTPGNFGKMGEPPTHPALLDWLAVEFVERKWSLKAMHRLMLTSAAYQMASVDMTANIAIDPENRLLWRMPRVRLEAEIIRDEILAVSGSLDRTIGGPAIFPFIDPDLFEKSSNRDWKGLPDSNPATWRRSLYVFSKRSIRYPMFETFDQPNLVNSTDRRNRTTIAPQALILMNNPMVLFQAGRFADRVKREAGDDRARQVARAIELALGRPADAVERRRGLEFIQSIKGSKDGLAEFCHLLLNLNEFVYRP
jgi:mono/diheme cytochrome c family protein